MNTFRVSIFSRNDDSISSNRSSLISSSSIGLNIGPRGHNSRAMYPSTKNARIKIIPHDTST